MGKRAARGELLRGAPAERLGAEVAAAVRRKPTQEARLAGVVRVLALHSAALRAALVDGVETLVTRGSYTRPLYAASVRALAEARERRLVPLLKRALVTEEAGGLPTLSASCCMEDPSLVEPLARVATNRHPHLAFAAEIARLARGDANGSHVAQIAPKIKESHRIELCSDLFVPLLRHRTLPVSVAPALAVLRDAERHLGRWMVLAEVAVRAGDEQPLREARERAASGPASARSAWAMVAWALSEGSAEPPDVRPTVELVARLSDRPSSDRDTTFLYRLAEARAPGARHMLEGIARSTALPNEGAVRAAFYLARDHGREDLKEALLEAAQNPRREALRGLAAAALYDLGEVGPAQSFAAALTESRQLATMAWGALLETIEPEAPERLVTEPNYRRLQLGWVE